MVDDCPGDGCARPRGRRSSSRQHGAGRGAPARITYPVRARPSLSSSPSPVDTSWSRNALLPPIVTCSRSSVSAKRRSINPASTSSNGCCATSTRRAVPPQVRVLRDREGLGVEEPARDRAACAVPVGRITRRRIRPRRRRLVAPRTRFEVLRVAEQVPARGSEERERDPAPRIEDGRLQDWDSASASSRRSSTGRRNSTSSSTRRYG